MRTLSAHSASDLLLKVTKLLRYYKIHKGYHGLDVTGFQFCFGAFPGQFTPLRSPLDALKDGEPAFIEVSRSAVLAAIESLKDQWQLPVKKIALGGFSQGAVQFRWPVACEIRGGDAAEWMQPVWLMLIKRLNMWNLASHVRPRFSSEFRN